MSYPQLRPEQLSVIRTVLPGIRQAQIDYNIPIPVDLAQVVIEGTGKVNGQWQWGGSSLYRLANNPFGMRWFRGLTQYPAYNVDTTEMINGVPVVQTGQPFIHFPDISTAIVEHAKLFHTKLYAPALAVANDWQAFATAIMNCGYSTDRPPYCKVPGCLHYAGKLIQIVRLYRFDEPLVLEYYETGILPTGA